MAYNRSSGMFQPKQDTGWGLIFRLNKLMEKIENDIENGNLEKWSFHIDRIFVNIIYKIDAEIIYEDEEQKKIADIKLAPEDIEVFSKLNQKIANIKNKISLNLMGSRELEDKLELKRLKEELYGMIFKKDIWIRKKMFKLNLYLKQLESDPRRAIYGG